MSSRFSIPLAWVYLASLIVGLVTALVGWSWWQSGLAAVVVGCAAGAWNGR